MSEIKVKITHLVKKYANDEVLNQILKDLDFDLESFDSDKYSFLDVHEARLATNRKMNNVVYGLEETVNNIKNSNTPVIVTNLIEKLDREAIIYTDINYSILFGIIK
jgi:hypothetical protein